MNQQNKPQEILDIEKLYGVRLKEVPLENVWKETLTYSLDEQGEVVGLNLEKQGIADISFLQYFSNLEELWLENNQITDISFLQHFPNLQELYLGNNQIIDISILLHLPNLQDLSLTNNQITDITVLQHLPNLDNLFVGNNQITDIAVLQHLPNLQGLYLPNNQITNIAVLQHLPNLWHLELDNNQISYLPLEILEKIPKLTLIHLEGNPIKNLTPELIKEINPKKILAYLREEAGKPLYEARVLVLGEGEAGKTTLIKKLLNPAYEVSGLPTTHGIEIARYGFWEANIHYTANVWDFGGQEIYHGTHRFFLSSRAVYILVSDNRKEDTDFRYWLDKIKISGKESPLLIVQNEKDNRKKNLPTEVNVGEFPNLRQVLQVNFADTNPTRFQDLVQAIQREFRALPHISTPFPKRWREVREAIEARQESYILYRDYKKMCEEAGIKEDESDIQAQLCEYLHDLGILLHFKSVDLLKKYVFLQPHWATRAVYHLTDHVGKGKFSPAEAEKVWAMPVNKGIFEDMTHELLALMNAFEICYAHENIYVLPQLLPENAPDYAWDNADNLQVVYRYGFMPKEILWRLMVRLHYLLPDDNLVWKHGAIFHREQARAEVTSENNVYKREVRIKVAGKERKELLVILLNEMTRINASYDFEALAEEKRPQINVPCNCAQCKGANNPHFYNYKELKQRLDKNKTTIECYKSYEDVLVHELIDEIRHTLENKTRLTDSERRRVEELLDRGDFADVFEILDRCEMEGGFSPHYYQKKMECISTPQGKSNIDLIKELRVLINTAFRGV